MRKMILYGKKYGGSDPQLVEGDIFRIVISVPEFTQSAISQHDNGAMLPGSSGKSSGKILDLLRANATISIPEIASFIGISERAVEKHIANLRRSNALRRVGPARGGKWEVLE
jgi:predicted HTH transcriptional regulator